MNETFAIGDHVILDCDYALPRGAKGKIISPALEDSLVVFEAQQDMTTRVIADDLASSWFPVPAGARFLVKRSDLRPAEPAYGISVDAIIVPDGIRYFRLCGEVFVVNEAKREVLTGGIGIRETIKVQPLVRLDSGLGLHNNAEFLLPEVLWKHCQVLTEQEFIAIADAKP